MRNRVIAGITRFPCYVKSTACHGRVHWLPNAAKTSEGGLLGTIPSSLQPPESVNCLLTIS